MINRSRLKKSMFFIFFCVSSLSTTVSAQEDIGSELPIDVRVLLIQEMIAILGSTQTITDAMVRGEDEVVAREAQQIHDSFILAQELTEEQQQALISTASDEFLRKDEALHKMSATLAEAARVGNKAEQREIFSQMLNACVASHTDHAAKRFPAFHQE